MKKISIILSLIFLPVMFAEGKGAPIIPGLKPIEPIVKPFRSVEKQLLLMVEQKLSWWMFQAVAVQFVINTFKIFLEKKEIQNP